MEKICLSLKNPISDSISRVQFGPQSNNLLISSWDSTLRLYDVDSSVMRFETTLGVALLGCCFRDEATAFSIGSDWCVRRCIFGSFVVFFPPSPHSSAAACRHNFGLGTCDTLGGHNDLATCIEYSEETCQLITSGLDKKICLWDLRMENGVGSSKYVHGEVESISVCGLYLVVAIGKSVSIYDLRNLPEPLQMNESSMEYQIKSVCSFPNRKGYAVGSIDGRVALESLDPSDANEMSCIFRCLPKSKDKKHHFVAVNDIVFNPCLYGAFVTGDNDGYAIMWDAQSKRRLYQFPRCTSSVASLSYNCGGQLLAVASSYTYQEANEIEEPPHVFIHRMTELDISSSSVRSSK